MDEQQRQMKASLLEGAAGRVLESAGFCRRLCRVFQRLESADLPVLGSSNLGSDIISTMVAVYASTFKE